ncbi:MAG: TonB-dependent receptor, partial [Deltaproteobacteria bacterium]
LGYQANLFDRLRAKLDLFYYDMKKFVQTLGDWIPISDLEGEVRTINEGEAKGIGGEVGLEYLIAPWLNGLINYSYQWIEDKDGNLLAANPRHKANLGLRATLANGISANILIHYTGATKKRYLLSLLPTIEDILEGRIGPQYNEVKLDPYILLNASVSYRLLDDRVEFAVSGQNLLDYKNYNDNLYNDPGGDSIPLTLFGSLKVKF